MAKPRSRVLDYLVYLLVRLAVCMIQALPFALAMRLAHALAWLAYRVDRRHRLVADDNLKHAFPGVYDEAGRDDLVRSVYLHFCTMLMEIIFLPRLLHPTTWHRYLELRGGDKIVGSLLSGWPLFLVTGHFGNWEMGGFALGLFGFRTHAIARPLDNPYVDRFLEGFRSRNGQGLIPKDGAADLMDPILAAGGAIATLGDQDAGRRGMYVNFFNRPASTHKAIALISLRYHVPLLVIGVPRVGKGLRYEVVAEDLILPEEYEGRPDAVRAMTERFTDALERLVRRYPEQYFWLHRRWKHQPKAKGATRAA